MALEFGEYECDRATALEVLMVASDMTERWRLVHDALRRHADAGCEVCNERLTRIDEQGRPIAYQNWLKRSVEPLLAMHLAPPPAVDDDGTLVPPTADDEQNAPPPIKMPAFIPVQIQGEDGKLINVRLPAEQMTLPQMEVYVRRRMRQRAADYRADLAVAAWWVAWKQSGTGDYRAFVDAVLSDGVAVLSPGVWAEARKLLAVS